MRIAKEQVTQYKRRYYGRPNKGKEYKVTWKGRTQTCAEWAKETGIKASVIYNRIVSHGWDVERTMTTVPSKISPEERMRRRRQTMSSYGI
jgi:hypothetical protein